MGIFFFKERLRDVRQKNIPTGKGEVTSPLQMDFEQSVRYKLASP
jgi:hypothetical protein